MSFNSKVMHDFRFLENVGTAEVDGKKYLTLNGEVVNASAQMTKSQFINKWVNQFSLGYIGEQSYFDFKEWFEISDGGRATIIVTEDEDPSKFLFIIPSFIDMGLNAEEARSMMQANIHMSQASGATDPTNATGYLDNGSRYIAEILGKKPRFIHELVPEWLYEELNINPDVNRQMMYCKNRYGIQPETPAWKYAEHCFRVMHSGVALNDEQTSFINALTQNEFVFPEGLSTESNIKLDDTVIGQQFDEC